MSSYIIAGSADSIDTAYCEQIARRIKSKYKNIDFRIVIKHPSEWEEYLQQICRIYGFLKKSNPIIYTFDGKIIGNKEAFMASTAKYFGLDEASLTIPSLTNEVNMKIASEEINQKHIQKHNIKSLSQNIEETYDRLLKKGLLKHELKSYESYMVNGVEYMHRNVPNIVRAKQFHRNKEVPVYVEEVQASDLDLMSISLNDQIKVEEQPPGAMGAHTSTGTAFVTAAQQQAQGSSAGNNLQTEKSSDHDHKSEYSHHTNKMQESNMSYDNTSTNRQNANINANAMKESSRSKSQIDEENDDIMDFVDIDAMPWFVCELGDDFHVAYNSDRIYARAQNTTEKVYIDGEMIFYKNESEALNGDLGSGGDPSNDSKANNSQLRQLRSSGSAAGNEYSVDRLKLGKNSTIRLYNDNRPINGHRVLIKEVHFDGIEELQGQNNSSIHEAGDESKNEQNASTGEQPNSQQQQQETNPKQQASKEDSAKEPQSQAKVYPEGDGPSKVEEKKEGESGQSQNEQPTLQKKAEQPNEKMNNQAVDKGSSEEPKAEKKEEDSEESVVEPQNSDLNLISHLSYHTLYIQKPLSQIELKNVLYFIHKTDSIGCLQFLPENPNPKMKLYNRERLLSGSGGSGQEGEKIDPESQNSHESPIEKFIQKQLEDEEFETVHLPNETCYDYDEEQWKDEGPQSAGSRKYPMRKINDIDFEHYIYWFESEEKGAWGENLQQEGVSEGVAQLVETYSRAIKYGIDSILSKEEELKRDIGYNLILTRNMIMIVPLVEPYEVYADNKLYFDGLAFLGCVHTAELLKGYEFDKKRLLTEAKKQPHSSGQSAGRKLRAMLFRSSTGRDLQE